MIKPLFDYRENPEKHKYFADGYILALLKITLRSKRF
jgi:hypothetical protein